MHPLEGYLGTLSEIHRTGGGTSETSYYAALEILLNGIGEGLKPKVRAVAQLADAGAGSPDFGLYAAHQFQRADASEPLPGQVPERGVVEVKGWGDDSFLTAKGSQVTKYWQRYGLVLVTNYRDFVLMGRDETGRPLKLETYRLAASAATFHDLLAHPRKAANAQGDRFVEFLRRVLLQSAPLTAPEDLAWFLASYAREARWRVEEAAGLPALRGLESALEESLGLTFDDERGDHFFRATLVQTLFYGIFSSWVLWARNHPGIGERFDWRAAGWTLHVPMIKSLFEQIATPSRLKPLGVDEVLDWAGTALNRVDREAFFQRFEAEHAVQYFYEPFLGAYDPELRKDLGVWYTPPEIVQYQVECVDIALREELGIVDGLADDSVVVLDPCCGTGAYLVETLKRIHRTLDEKGGGALSAYKLKMAAMERVFGFEILPAPFVIAHLQLGLMLRQLGAPFDNASDERAGVYLTNALTGWEPPSEPKKQLPLFPEFMEERDAANRVKQDAPVLVVIGNPPYNAFAGTSPVEEGGLVEIYKEGLTAPMAQGGWGIKKFNLDDLYVRFLRIAERRIVKSGMGVVSFISNHSYLGDPSFVVMRQHLLREFDSLCFDCMNGDSRETGKRTPEGAPDPSVFSTEHNREGIRVGTAVCLLVRHGQRAKRPVVRYRDYWGVNKRRDLLASLRGRSRTRGYTRPRPAKANRFSFRPSTVSKAYLNWPRVPDLALEHHNGPVERRGNSLIVFPDKTAKLKLLIPYLDDEVSDEEVARIAPAFMRSSGEFDAKRTRVLLKDRAEFDENKMVKYPFKPFDVRIAYLDADIAPLFSRPSPQLLEHATISGHRFFITRDTADKFPEGPPFYFSPHVCDYDSISGHARHFPLWIRHGCATPRDIRNGQCLFEDAGVYCVTRANLSDTSRHYLRGLGIANPESDPDAAERIWLHALAIGYSPAYLAENADGIRQDWPRIPLPASRDALDASAALGRRIAALVDSDAPVAGVTRGKIDTHLKQVAVISRCGGGALDPVQGHLDLTAGWGYAGRGGVCMPGHGKAEPRRQPEEPMRLAFGTETLDVYLNDAAFWANVPQPVWDYTIGGYQVIKKWLSYREKNLLGRGLTMNEAVHVTGMARRIAAIHLAHPQLDANYEAVKSDSWSWPEP